MKLQEEEIWRPYYRTTGYCNRGPLGSCPAPYVHHAVCNRGELSRTFVRLGDAKSRRGRSKKQKD